MRVEGHVELQFYCFREWIPCAIAQSLRLLSDLTVQVHSVEKTSANFRARVMLIANIPTAVHHRRWAPPPPYFRVLLSLQVTAAH